MRKRKIPCAACKSTTQHLEKTGKLEVISCEPILGRNDWCLLIYHRRSGPKMRKEEVFCTECQCIKEHMEKTSKWEVISCEPIPDSGGKCKLIYQKISVPK